MRGSFTPHNTIGSKKPPTFRQQRSDSPDKHSEPRLPKHPLTTRQDLLYRQKQSHTPESVERSVTLSELGDSSSLFSNTPASFDFGTSIKSKNKGQPIPFVFGIQKESEQRPQSNMVNERSPAKASLAPVSLYERPIPPPEDGVSSKPAHTGAPKFGETSFPESPLYRPRPPKEPMFIQPKNRPELHRDIPKSSHPHLHAFKDAARGAVDQLLGKPSASTSVAAPMPQASQYTTTKAAPPQMFGSMGNTYGGFASVNNSAPKPYSGYNYIDLTANNYRDEPLEPYTFVDAAKAQEDLKALLEGVIEDEDDVPATRSRRKRKEAEADQIIAKLSGLSVKDDKLDVASDEEEEDDGSVEGIKVKLLPHQVEGLDWMTGRELGTGKKGVKVPKGGILADDMGLGKTLQSISLVLTNSKPTDEALLKKRKLPSGVEKTTLVVAPLALIRQWEAEIKDKVTPSHSLRVCVHHGPQRTKHFQDLKKFDVVITTYQILVSEHGNSSNEEGGLQVGCFGLHWYRVILDEAHQIKNRNAKATKACYALRSEYRWCLTGTPMQNNLDELQSLIKFLRVKPYDDLREWKDQIDRPMKNGRGDLAIKRLRTYLQIIMKRRTKEILKKDGALNPGGKPTGEGKGSSLGFKVTERKIEKVFAEFSPEERRFYQRLEDRTDASIEQMMEGKVNYASALVLLLRLRQACNHPQLVAGKLSKDSEALASENGASQKSIAKSSSIEVDEMADLFGNLGVGSKKCEVCQLDLGKTAIAEGAIRCLDCEADLKDITKQHKSLKEKKKKQKHDRHIKPEPQAVVRKARNRNVIEDSDDEEDQEGSWVVPEGQRGALTLGKAGGQADEDAEGGGEWLDSEADETFPPLEQLSQDTGKNMKNAISLDSDSETDSDSESDSEVEDEFGSSDDDRELSTMITSTKITHLLKILGKEAAEHKFIVFSQFTSMLDLIEPFLRQKGFKFTRYDGKMKNDDREASLGRLRNDKNCRILLCSLKCGSLGLNLTAATRVVILEPFWNPFVEEQAIDRVHRLTQKIDVIVYKITIKDSVEERILDLQEKKRELANQTIEGGKGGAGKLGMKEILQLFRRDAEHAPVNPGDAKYDLGGRPRILKDASREGSVMGGGISERRVTPPVTRPGEKSKREDEVYGRRW